MRNRHQPDQMCHPASGQPPDLSMWSPSAWGVTHEQKFRTRLAIASTSAALARGLRWLGLWKPPHPSRRLGIG